MNLVGYIEDALNRLSNLGEFSKSLVTIASAAGIVIFLIYSIRILFSLIQVVRLYLLSRCLCKVNFVTKYGRWAVVSGATDGIGQSMAKELAKRGMSVLVLGRNEEKLAKTKAMLEQLPNVGEVETVKIDFSDDSLENYERLRDQIKPDERDIGVLINNVGVCPSDLLPFNSHEMAQSVEMVHVNVMAPICLTRMIMPGMLQRRRGLVMNVSSMGGSVLVPLLGVYAPTKAFLNSFTRQLQVEYGSEPVDIVLLRTGPVFTKIVHPIEEVRKPALIPTADAYAKSAIEAQSAGIKSYSGCMFHEIVILITNLIIALGLSSLITRAMLSSNDRYKKKAADNKLKRDLAVSEA